MEDIYLEIDAFVRAIGVNRQSRHSLFLGAGASITSGVSSAEMSIWEWKRNIFVTSNPGVEKQVSELSLDSVRQKIQNWLGKNIEAPNLSSPDEYGFYIQKCYSSSENRRRYFQEKIRSAKPHIGYQLLCLLSEVDLIDSVWTTNFDGFVARAAASFNLTPIEVGIDSQNRLPSHLQKGELLCVSLHGDYRYDELKNTVEELREQEKLLREALVKNFSSAPVIVCGYSGRDKSIMESLTEAYSKNTKSTLYWCGFGSYISQEVKELIAHARKNGHEAYFVPGNGFDDLMTRLSLYCLLDKQVFLDRAHKIISTQKNPGKIRQPFNTPSGLTVTGIIKSNAFEIDCPSEVFEFNLKTWPEQPWSWLESQAKDNNIVAVPYKRKILALGSTENMKRIFSSNISGTISRTPIGENDLDENGAINSLLRKALIQSLAKNAELETNGRSIIWEKSSERRPEGNAHKSVILTIRKIETHTYLILKPSIYVTDNAGQEVSFEISNKVKNAILGYQHNKEFNDEIDIWRKKLFGEQSQVLVNYPASDNSPCAFSIQTRSVYAELSQTSGNRLVIQEKWRPYIRYKGQILQEPNLLFSNLAGSATAKDKYPLRGLVNNRPYDYSLTQTGLMPKIDIGVVCPNESMQVLENYLHTAQNTFEPHEREYLVNFPGFNNAFGIPLNVPRQNSHGWHSCPEPHQGVDSKTGALQLAHNITKAIESLYASYKPNVIIIFIPDRWQNWRRYETEEDTFDLHNFVKAFCVQRGITTQFLEEQTIIDNLKCRVWWWLSVALYSKAMRTPWVLETLNSDTAFVGLGFSLRHKAQNGKHVVLGCSHIYNAQGEGLKFRLSKIENPIFDNRKNPFMSQEDARQVGETIRSLFYESRSKLPKRVVVHKLTPFRDAEIKGLFDGLSGVDEIDLIEINFDSQLRYVSSKYKDSKIQIDGFPIKRGTIVQLDDFSALVWAHGSINSIQVGRTYFQGGRRIPTPLIIRKYAGKTNLDGIAGEILGLSKMDWNSADMYSQLPVTLNSSQKIAQIGSLLQRLDPVSFDYRLFI